MFFNRKNYFLAGALVLLLGAELQMVDSFTLSEGTTRALARMSKPDQVASKAGMASLLMSVHPEPRKRVEPPSWLGLTLIASGTFMCCHAFATRRR
jgi:hypothetical protein